MNRADGSSAASRHVAARVHEDAPRGARPTCGEAGLEQGLRVAPVRAMQVAVSQYGDDRGDQRQPDTCADTQRHEQRRFNSSASWCPAVPHAQRQLAEDRRTDQGGQQQQPRARRNRGPDRRADGEDERQESQHDATAIHYG